MRLYELTESIRGTEMTVEQAVELIKKDCTQIVSAYRNTDRVFFRGVNSTKEAFRGIPHANRKPRDSMPEFHEFLTNMLAAAGAVAGRNNGTFVSSNHGAATMYVEVNDGDVYVIFPLDGFHYTWMRNILDATEIAPFEVSDDVLVSKLIRDINAAPELKDLHMLDSHDIMFGKFNVVGRFRNIVKDRSIKTTPVMDKFIKDGMFGMVTPESFAAKTGLLVDSGLEDALESDGNEVVFTGPYYAVNASEADILLDELDITI